MLQLIDNEEIAKLPRKKLRIANGLKRNHENDDQTIIFNHSIMCQNSLPFKNMGNIREWKSRNGNAVVVIQAGSLYSPKTRDTVELGLPYGPKPRLILLHLNSQAIKQQSPEIEIEDSLYAFIRAIGLHGHGHDYRVVKDQLARLAASHLTIGRTEADGTGTTSFGRIVSEVKVWFPEASADRQRILWPNKIKLSDDYFQELVKHAVPLDRNALHLLKDSALELDLYAMLAERLHRIKPGKPQFIPWSGLFLQYGRGYSRLRDFRANFIKSLTTVKAVYPDADIENTTSPTGRPKGLTLFHSRPPVLKKSVVCSA